MADSVYVSAKISFLVIFILSPSLSLAISSCNGRSEVCFHDLSRRSRRPSPGNGFCKPTGFLKCHGESKPQPTFNCSPPVTSSTKAILTNNDFSRGGSGGSPSECDGKFHDNSERVVALSTGWFNHGSICGKTIRIRDKNGRKTTAKVVDECDSLHGCDKDHDGQPPCRNNIVDGSNAVWHALGLDINVGEVPVTWSVA